LTNTRFFIHLFAGIVLCYGLVVWRIQKPCFLLDIFIVLVDIEYSNTKHVV